MNIWIFKNKIQYVTIIYREIIKKKYLKRLKDLAHSKILNFLFQNIRQNIRILAQELYVI